MPDGYQGNLPDYDDRSWYAGTVSFPDIRGDRVGYLQFFVDVSSHRNQVASSAYILYAGVVAIILAAAAFLFVILRRADSNISTRLNHLHYLAYTDPLTMLANRKLFADRLMSSLKMAADNDRMLAVLFLDLDDFKSVNDSLGHSAGDELLRQVTRRLNACIRDGDTLARQGGDEFALVLPNVDSTEQVAAMAKSIIQALKHAVIINGREVSTGVSIGISLFPQNGTTPEELMRNADAAMYMAKASGKNCFSFYTSDLTVSAIQKITLLSELKRALSQGNITLDYQPIIHGQNGKHSGFEALARWHHPVQGYISPRTFVDLAEECGLINELGAYLITEVCRQIHHWLIQGFDPGYVSINLSVAQIENEDFGEFISSQLTHYSVPADMIALEITESALMKNKDCTVAKLTSLGKLGMSIWIDDFGTGYSSLAYLKQLPVDLVKIDASFVQDIPYNPDDLAIVRAIIGMARALNLEVLAEGVESAEQAACLNELGCHYLQGYFFSRPLVSKDVVTAVGSRESESI